MNKFKLIKLGHRVVSVGLGVVAVAVPTATTVMAEEVQNEWEKPRAEFIEDAEFNALLEKMKADNAYTLVEDSPVKDGDLSSQVTEMKQAVAEVEATREQYAKDMADYKQAVEDYKAAKISYDEMVRIYNEKKAEYDAKVAQNEQLKQENERLTAEYNAKKQQYDTDLAAYNQNVADIKRIKQENEDKKNAWIADKAQIESRNKQKKKEYDKKVAKRQEAVDENNRQISEYEGFLTNNPLLIDFSHRGVQLRGNYDESYGYHDKGENTVYKNWWIATNQSGIQGLPDPSQMDFHNYGGANPSKYFENVFTMYDDDTLSNTGYEYSLGDIGITNKTTMSVTYKDPRVAEFDDSYGHSYRLFSNAVENGFLRFDLHNLGTTKSGKTISAHVTVNKWKADRDRATFTYRQVGDMGGYGEGAQVKYEFYDEDTGEKLNLVRMFEMLDTEAGEYLHVASNDRIKMIIPNMPSDVRNGVTRGYATIVNEAFNGAGLLGDKYFANANFVDSPNQPVTRGNNDSTPLAMGIGMFAGNTLTASWNGAGGGLNLNSRNILFKEKPARITDDSYPVPKVPDYEKIPNEPQYEEVPTAMPEPLAPTAPTLNTIVDPVAPTAPGEAPAEPKKPEDINVARTIHYHRAYRLKPVTTKWVDEDGKELKPPVTDNTTKEHGDIDGYSFVRSDEDTLENVTHVFKQHTTSWVDIDTEQPLKDTVKGIKEHGDINEYYFVETETKPTGDVVHKFKQIVTTFVAEEGKEVFPQEKGKQKEKPHKDYSYKKTETDEHGNVKHIYHMFHTEFMDEDKNRVANREDGAQPHRDIPGYEYIRSIPEPDKDLVTHIYRQITTSWLDENGKELKPVDKGSQPHGEFTGYTYVKTETDTHGNIIHTFKRNGDVPTGVASTGFISLITSGLSVLGITILNKKKREA